MAIGDRLREERERLRLSQADFAEKAGVHRNTQVRYESDKREPDSSYLEAIRALGIDVDYVLFGHPNAEAPVECPFLQSRGIERPFTLDECRRTASGRGRFGGSIASAHGQACPECPKNPIKRGPSIESSLPDVDGRLLENVLEALEVVLARKGVALAPPKKARTTAMLYRVAKASGRVDPKMVEDAVEVAL